MPEFQWLASLCDLANETLTSQLTLFASDTLVTDRAQVQVTIEARAETALDHFRRSTPRAFVRTLDTIEHMIHGNGIISSILSNWHFYYDATDNYQNLLRVEPRSYGTSQSNCSCGLDAKCTSWAFIDTWLVPGFHVGCYPLEALLQSTLECLYSDTCLNTLSHFSNVTIQPLDSSTSSSNVAVQSLVDHLMVDRWETSVSYDRYYAACAPSSCTYSTSGRADLIFIVTTFIGLCGGLNVVLKLVAPLLMSIGSYIIRLFRTRVEPVPSVTLAHA